MLRWHWVLAMACLFGTPLRAEDPVHFADDVLKQAVESKLWVLNPTPSDMLGLTDLICVNKDISDLTKAKDSFVREAASKENRFLMLLTAINTLWHDEAFIGLVKEEQINDRPELVGKVGYET